MVRGTSSKPYTHRSSILTIAIALSLAASSTCLAQSFDESVLDIQARWATAADAGNRHQQGKVLKVLLDDARKLHAGYADKPEAAAWHGIVARTYLDTRGSFASMRVAREARNALLAAESMDPFILDGLVYANLGSLYSKVPSSFGGFGSKTRGIGYLWKAIVVDPDNIDSNYLYADVLLDEKDYLGAREALIRAKEAAATAHPSPYYAGQQQISTLLAKVEHALR